MLTLTDQILKLQLDLTDAKRQWRQFSRDAHSALKDLAVPAPPAFLDQTMRMRAAMDMIRERAEFHRDLVKSAISPRPSPRIGEHDRPELGHTRTSLATAPAPAPQAAPRGAMSGEGGILKDLKDIASRGFIAVVEEIRLLRQGGQVEAISGDRDRLRQVLGVMGPETSPEPAKEGPPGRGPPPLPLSAVMGLRGGLGAFANTMWKLAPVYGAIGGALDMATGRFKRFFRNAWTQLGFGSIIGRVLGPIADLVLNTILPALQPLQFFIAQTIMALLVPAIQRAGPAMARFFLRLTEEVIPRVVKFSTETVPIILDFLGSVATFADKAIGWKNILLAGLGVWGGVKLMGLAMGLASLGGAIAGIPALGGISTGLIALANVLSPVGLGVAVFSATFAIGTLIDRIFGLSDKLSQIPLGAFLPVIGPLIVGFDQLTDRFKIFGDFMDWLYKHPLLWLLLKGPRGPGTVAYERDRERIEAMRAERLAREAAAGHVPPVRAGGATEGLRGPAPIYVGWTPEAQPPPRLVAGAAAGAVAGDGTKPSASVSPAAVLVAGGTGGGAAGAVVQGVRPVAGEGAKPSASVSPAAAGESPVRATMREAASYTQQAATNISGMHMGLGRKLDFTNTLLQLLLDRADDDFVDAGLKQVAMA